MPQPFPAPKAFRFGPFEFDPKSGHLRGESSTHRLADQPLALLNALLERPGEMVSREELRGRLWPDGTFVDFEHGLNSAVSRLREALNDSANTPRFVETIPRRGYRLLVPVEADGLVVVDEVAPAEPFSADDGAQHAARSMVREPAMAWRVRPAVAWMGVAATGLFLVAVAIAVQFRRDARPVPLVTSVVIDLPDDWVILNESPAISPDSRHIVFSALHGDGRRAIWHRPLDASAARMLADTQDGSEPFWSPDGKSIGFFAEGKLKVLQLAGGSARVLCDATPEASGTWIRPDVILFAPGPTGAVSEVSVERGTVRQVTEIDRSKGELRHVRPTSLPDGRHFVYLANRKDQLIATLASVDGTGGAALGPVRSHVEAAPSGHVLFVRDGTLLAQPLDIAAGRLTGDATVLADGLTLPGRFSDGRFSTSPAMLVYLKATERSNLTELRIFDRSGKMGGTVGEPAGYVGPSLSPDGTRLAVGRHELGVPARDIWVFDLARGTRLRLTLDRGDDLAPKWSSDGKWLMFSSDRRGVRDIYKRLASGEGADELVFESAISKSLNAWSPDGRFVVYDTGGLGGTADLHVLPLTGDRRPIVRASQPGFQHMADISPDGRLIAYASSESGKYEVIVESFPEKGGRRQISTNGGKQPAWRGDGRELFFLADDTMMAVDVHPPRLRPGQAGAAGIEWGVPRALFKISKLQGTPFGFTVSPDGQRFIAVVAAAPREPQRFTTLLNWTSLVK
jgi:Tol biopolymer transport system component/DNA-binding winged helix-turn-helix (wHTH) protein